MTNEQEFINQFEAEVQSLEIGLQRAWCEEIFYNKIIHWLGKYINSSDVVFITKQDGSIEHSLYIVLQREKEKTIHLEVYLDTQDAWYAVFQHTDMMQSDAGIIEQLLEYIIDIIDPKPVVFTGTKEDIQKAMAWAEENLKI